MWLVNILFCIFWKKLSKRSPTKFEHEADLLCDGCNTAIIFHRFGDGSAFRGWGQIPPPGLKKVVFNHYKKG